MSTQAIHRLQAVSALKAGSNHKPHSQYHIHYAHSEDRQHVSVYSERVLRTIMQKAGVHSIIITSTVRTEREQAETMLHNLQTGVNVRYARAGRSVNAVAMQDFTAGKSHDQIIADMLKQINKVGFAHVTKHGVTSGLNTLDISGHYLKTGSNSGDYGRFVDALKNAVISNQISRFGWPEGPVGNGRCFNDKGCLHVEIAQPVLYDANAKPGPTTVA